MSHDHGGHGHHDDHGHHDHHGGHDDHGHHHEAPAGTPEDDIVDCPVMPGSSVSKSIAEQQGLYRDYEGERYWFCCAVCPPMFDANPEAYIKAA
ncbi:MAG: hypothetical protein CMF57_00995 [Leifsonia sp.]|jgi:YHS domain-containing protein|nr:hypothetical protein [Leifsonia sp.]HBS74828.1 hypothetical protein [Microbacterium sp.]|tara:strand:- start:23390 stop:23671 length:282 start_codon:yes stop_codon:yes gene_type:complete